MVPEALGYRPDRERLWGRISRRQARPRRMYLLWVSHAAAVLIGILLVTLLPARHERQAQQAPAVITIAAPPPAVIAAASSADTPPAQTKNRRRHPAPGRPATKASPGTALSSVVAAPHEPELQQPGPRQPGIPEDAPPVATLSPRERGIHLSDIDNENSGAGSASPATVWERFFPDRASGPATAAAPAAVFYDYLTRSKK